jgi:hypothetical protein
LPFVDKWRQMPFVEFVARADDKWRQTAATPNIMG